MSKNHYDVIVIDSGAGGGVIAGILAEAGKRVLLLERGPGPGALSRDHLRNQRLSQYGDNAGPDWPSGSADAPRVIENFRNGSTRVVIPHEGGYHNNAALLGGGTRVYGAQAWRFHPLDFKMATTYGVPEGSSLADWPITYEELAPFYEQAEYEVGVAGDAVATAHAIGHKPFARPYPMPPVTPGTLSANRFAKAASTLGWRTAPVPLLINSVERHGRPACAHCGECVGFDCPVDAKNGTQNTLIPRGLVSGKLTLETGAMVSQIDRDASGRVIGVTYFNAQEDLITERADVVVVSGGAIETARLLKNSGLGNDHVGRHLQGHCYSGAGGVFEEDVFDGIGPGVSIVTCDFLHGNPDVIGGALLADEFIPLPITYFKRSLPPTVPRWGAEAKRWMRENYRRTSEIKGPIQEIPTAHARVTVDPTVRDRWGIPVARLSGSMHPETLRAAAFIHERAKDWLQAAGAIQIWGSPPGMSLSGGQHQAGTCRMSDDPADGATDRWCRIHGHDNLYIGDGSVHVTNGGFNPVLTILALAYRTADHIARSW